MSPPGKILRSGVSAHASQIRLYLWSWNLFPKRMLPWSVLFCIQACWGTNAILPWNEIRAPFQCKDRLSRHRVHHCKDKMVVLSLLWEFLYQLYIAVLVITTTSTEHQDILIHWSLDCLFSSFFRPTSNGTSKLGITAPLWRESTGDRRILLKKGQ